MDSEVISGKCYFLVLLSSSSPCHPSPHLSLANSAWIGKYLMYSLCLSPTYSCSAQYKSGTDWDLPLSCMCPPFSLPSGMEKKSYRSRFLIYRSIFFWCTENLKFVLLVNCMYQQLLACIQDIKFKQDNPSKGNLPNYYCCTQIRVACSRLRNTWRKK